jgi:hypothetical protein
VLALIRKTWGSLEDAPEHIQVFAQSDQFPATFRHAMIRAYIDRDPGRQRGGPHLREA